MSDSRDTNHDGKVSLMEKVKDKLHLGHKDNDTYTSTHNSTSTHHTTAMPATHQTTTTAAMPAIAAVPAVAAMPVAAMPVAAMPMATADSRDLNRDGHVSTSEKLRSDFGAQSSTGAFDSRDLNRDGHISTSEKLESGFGARSTSAGAFDSRDLNRDGHISTSEKLRTDFGTQSSTGAFDSRDLNRDGHVSTGEKLASATGARTLENDEARLRLHEEQLAVSKREVSAGEVGIHKRVEEERVEQSVALRREEVIVERRPLSGIADPNARIGEQDEILRVPLHREEIVTEKRIVPTEEVIVRKKEVIDHQTVGATLRSEYVDTVQTGMSQNASMTGAYDSRDLNRDGHVSMGEKFKSASGSNMAGGAYDARDTNLDGHVSTGEKLKSAATGTSNLKAARG